MDAVRAAEFVLEEVRASAQHLWYQGRRKPPLALDSSIESPALRLIAEHRISGVGELEARALIGWAAGARSALLAERALEVREIVALQAKGRRCVTILPGAEGLDFALHDLRHLEKFFDPAHHRTQIGFFRMFDRALAGSALRALDAQLDEAWRNERDRVLADMNGSPIFLFAVMKMKLKVAARRLLAAEREVPPPARGPLDREELAAYEPLLELFLDALDLREALVRDAARALSARRDHPSYGRTLLEHFARI